MKRKLPEETVQDFDHLDHPEFATLRCKLLRWANDNHEGLAKAQPQIPTGFNNRLRRNWWMLLAIAELAGDDWADTARKAARDVESIQEATSIEIELLTDIRKAFDTSGGDEISTKTLITTLCLDEEAPWATYAKGKPITDRHLARMLKSTGSFPGTCAPTASTRKDTCEHSSRTPGGATYRATTAGARHESPRSFSPLPPPATLYPCKRANAQFIGLSCGFRIRARRSPHGSKISDLSPFHRGLHACTLSKPDSSGGREEQ
jgi:uncharacterized protein DUF3631